MNRRKSFALAGILAVTHLAGCGEAYANAKPVSGVILHPAIVLPREVVGAAGPAGIESEADLDMDQGTGYVVPAGLPVTERVVVSTLAAGAGLHTTYITKGHCVVVAGIAGKTGDRVLVVDGLAPTIGLPIAGRIPSAVC